MRIFHLKRQLLIGLLLSFFLGILYVNIMNGKINDTNETFSQYYLNQYMNMKIDTGEFLVYLLRVRVLPIIAVAVLSFTRLRKITGWGSVVWTGFLGGFLMALAVLYMGIKGSLLCVVAVFPHFLFYVPAYIVVLWYGMTYPQSQWNVQKTLFVTGGMLAGILLEAYLNPVIMRLFIGSL